MNAFRNLVAIVAVLSFVAFLAVSVIAGLTGGEATDSEQDTIRAVFVPIALVILGLVTVLAPAERKRNRRR